MDLAGDSGLWKAKHGYAALPELSVCVISDTFAQVLGLFGDGVNPAIASLASSFLPPRLSLLRTHCELMLN